MVRGIYAAATAMMMNQVKQDAIANNLANLSTVGYKGDIALFEDMLRLNIRRVNDLPESIGQLGTGVVTKAVVTSYEEGPIRETGNPLDLAIVGDGFFALNTPDGIRYTRAGNFTLNDANQLVSSEGHLVVGQNGPIVLTNPQVSINEQGEVFENGRLIDRVEMVDFEKPYPLRKIGHNLFAAQHDAPVLPGGGRLKQGTLEMPNINVAEEMVRMITVMRSYEAAQKALSTQDEMNGKAVLEIGRVNG